MARTPQQAGKLSRDKGKRFERHVAKHIMPKLTGWEHWKRTQRGDKQHYGDLVPCDEKGMEMDGVAHNYYVECRTRATLSSAEIMKWMEETEEAARNSGRLNCFLVVKQDRGPIWVLGDVTNLGAGLLAQMFQ